MTPAGEGEARGGGDASGVRVPRADGVQVDAASWGGAPPEVLQGGCDTGDCVLEGARQQCERFEPLLEGRRARQPKQGADDRRDLGTGR